MANDNEYAERTRTSAIPSIFTSSNWETLGRNLSNDALALQGSAQAARVYFDEALTLPPEEKPEFAVPLAGYIELADFLTTLLAGAAEVADQQAKDAK